MQNTNKQHTNSQPHIPLSPIIAPILLNPSMISPHEIKTSTVTTTTTSSSGYSPQTHIVIVDENPSLQPRVPDETRSQFAPYPRDLPPSLTSFAIDFTSDMNKRNVQKAGKSFTIDIFNKIMKQHTRQPTTSTTSTSTSTSSSSSDHLVSTYINEHIYDITRIFLRVPPDESSRQFSFYIHMISPQACTTLRHIIIARTTLTCRDVTDQIITGKFYPLPMGMKSSIIRSYIQSLVPSFAMTKSRRSGMSSHYHEHGFFAVRASDLHLLADVGPLPGCRSPLTWERMLRPTDHVVMCSLCYQHDHTRRHCQHLLQQVTFCSNCGKQGHHAKNCDLGHQQCLCCFEINNHSYWDCEKYKPTFRVITFKPSHKDFPPLPSRPTSTTNSESDYVIPSPTLPEYDSDTSRSPTHSQHKRRRHTSFDTESVDSHDSRENRMLSPAFQLHLDKQSLTRRSPTPSPARDPSRSSSRSSNASKREQELEQLVKQQQLQIQQQRHIIDQQEQQIKQQKQQATQQQQEISQMKQQLETIMKQLDITSTHTPTTQTTTVATSSSQHDTTTPMRD